jgi:uncharacterized protein YbaP (TraB family)
MHISLRFLIITLTLFCSFHEAFAQKKYQSLLWKVSGNGLSKPSYLYGTMHVSEKMVFQLGDPFFNAMEEVDVVALELEPDAWLQSMFAGNGFRNFEDDEDYYSGRSNQLEGFFTFETDIQTKIKDVIAYEPPLLNYMLFRFDDYSESADFEENTWLDMYIYQTGKKMGKRSIGLETYEQSTLYGKLARKAENNEKIQKSFDNEDRKKMRELQSQIEPAYRRQDLDLVDSINVKTNSPAFNKYILVERNRIFVNTIDSLFKAGSSVFAAMGCAHLPGQEGVIEMLRGMGYSVEAVDKGTRDAKRRDKLDKIIYKRPYSTFTSSDATLSFDTPAKVYPFASGTEASAWLAMDIPNGANFSVYRFKNYAGYTGKSNEYLIASIDSILYEAIPGDIISLKKTNFQNFPAFDIVNKTRRGDVQRRRIIFAPEEIYVLKLTALKDKISNKYGEEFFNSFKINYDNKVRDTRQWSTTDQSLQVSIPGDLTYYQGESEYDFTSDIEVTSFDKKTGAYYIIWRFTSGDPTFLDEDQYIIQSVAQQYLDDNELDKLSEQNFTISGFPAVFGKYRNKEGKTLFGAFTYQNLNKYAFVVKTEDEALAKNFFSSVRLEKPTYSTFYNYSDTLLNFKMKIPYDLNERHKKMDYGFNWDSEDDVNEAEGVRKTIRIIPPGSPESIQVRMIRYHKYFQSKDTTTFLKEIKERISEYGDLRLRERMFEKNKDGFVAEYLVTDTSSHRATVQRLHLYKNTLYRLIASTDTILGESDFVKTGFQSFTPLDRTFDRSVFDDGGADYLSDIASTDSTTQKNALLLIDEVWIHEKNAPDLRRLLTNLPNTEEKKDKEEIKNTLLLELWRDTSTTNIEWLSAQYYANADSASYQNKILQNLGWMNTKEATLRMKKLMMDEPPIGGKSSTSSPLLSLKDTLELARLIYPEAFALSSIDEFKYANYSLLAALCDSNKIDKKMVESELNLILLEAKNELKRVNGTDEKSYNFSTNALMNYCSILHPFRNKPDVKAFFDKIYKSKKRQLLIEYISFNEDHKIETPDSILNFITDEREYILKLYLKLIEKNKEQKMPARYLVADTLLRLHVEKKYEGKYDQKGKIDFVEILSSREEVIKNKPYTVYYVKFKRKREIDWRGTVIIVPKSRTLWTAKPWEASGTAVLDSKESEQKKMDKLYRDVVRANRKNRYGENLYDFNSYNTWNE